MAAFSNPEYTDIGFIYGKVDENAAEAQRLYQVHFSARSLPNVQVFINTYRRISEKGEPGVRDEQYAPQVDKQILEVFEADPSTSIRKTAHQLNVSIRRVWSDLNIHSKHASL